MLKVVVHAVAAFLEYLLTILLLYSDQGNNFVVFAFNLIAIACRNFMLDILFLSYSMAEFANAKSKLILNDTLHEDG